MASGAYSATTSSTMYTCPTGKVAKVIIMYISATGSSTSVIIGGYGQSIAASEVAPPVAGFSHPDQFVTATACIVRTHYIAAGQTAVSSIGTGKVIINVIEEDA